jgi:hypothetical protein
MTRSLTRLKAESGDKVDKGAPEMWCKALGADTDIVVNIRGHSVVATSTWTGALAEMPRVGDAGSGSNLSAVHPGETVGFPLGGQHGTTVAKREGGVKIDRVIDLDGEERNLAGVDRQTTEVAGKVHSEAHDDFTRVHSTNLGDVADDVLNGRQRNLPRPASIPALRDKLVDALSRVCTVCNNSPCQATWLGNSSKRGDGNRERQLVP